MNHSPPNLDSTEVIDGAPAISALRTRRGRFVLNGETVYLIGVGPVVLTANHDPRPLVDQLAALATPAVRFRIRLETWGFCWHEDALCPWARTDAGYNLEAFHSAFWHAAADLAAYANERGVLLEFVLFDALSLKAAPGRTGWWRNPFNTANGGPIAERSAVLFCQSDGQAWEKQRTFLLHAVDSLRGLPNVTWELLSSLDGADPVLMAWVSDLVGLLGVADKLERLVSASVAAAKRTDTALYGVQGIDTAGFDWQDGGISELSFAETVAELPGFGKPIVNHRVTLCRDADSDRCERERFEQAAESGAHTILRPETLGADWLKAFIDSIRATTEGQGT
jgi:hypothetical protein